MKTFRINKEYEIVCEWKKTKIAFKHEATLLKNDNEIDSVKICYQNRTWERFTYESVIEKLLDKTQILKGKAKERFLEKAYKGECEETKKEFGLIGKIAQLGEVFGQNQKEKNDWKTRMIKVGLGNKGLIIPEDWDTLNEDDKQKRLDGVINQLNEKI